jgi:hypothetical protein
VSPDYQNTRGVSGEDRKIEAMKIQLNKEVMRYLNITKGMEPSTGAPFIIYW